MFTMCMTPSRCTFLQHGLQSGPRWVLFGE
jgi:hypothetical protein